VEGELETHGLANGRPLKLPPCTRLRLRAPEQYPRAHMA